LTRLADSVADTLSDAGLLAQRVGGFQPRQGQTEMAMAVVETIEEGGALVVEAGTGVGKTFAYLVPVLLSGQRALVSTATKALQDQLFSRDIPRLALVLNLPVRVALLKGRSSYLCLHRMEQARHSPQAAQAAYQRAIAKVESWSQVTQTGDMAELPGLDESSSLWPLVTSTRDNCLGSNCPRYRACHVNLARKEAMAADVVVINHHLFFADLAVRESGVAELLPTVRVTVFDEAHQLNEIGVNFLGQDLSTVQLLELARDVLATGLQLARGLVDWQALWAGLEKATRDWRLAAGQHRGAVRLRWAEGAPQGVALEVWRNSLDQLHTALETLRAGLDQVTELAPDFQRLMERTVAFAQRARQFASEPDADAVRWAEVSAQLRLIEAPLDIADTFAKLTQPVSAHPSDDPAAEPAPLPVQRAWVFTSATLGADERLSWFTQPCGLTSARTMRVGSPFDYDQQAALYVPEHLPKPADPSHARQVAQLALEAVTLLGGRTLVLTTTLNAMRVIGEYLQSRFDSGLNIEVLVQGQSPKRKLMERFREGRSQGGAGCVLVASASFWEGFDVPGDALQLVIIDKLPFPPPDDPLFEARSQRLTREGRSPFAEHALPEAAVALKQGAGRLIRSETDRGVLVVCDTRLSTMSYGKRLMSALPPMRLITSRDDFVSEISALAQDSPELPPA
jgi:ATP-dependent DNA helicase DinG